MTEKLGTLTAKIDALRAKGFSDDEINQLLSSSMPAEAPESPFNIGEIFNNCASKDEWNQQVDDTEQLYIKQGSYCLLFIGLGMIAGILGIKGYYPFEVGFSLVVACIVINFLVITYFMPKEREKIKFFIKKRR
ncbi:hypothetical protein C5F63_13165 [Photobacterium damselae subsp. damselae]|uniref:hypothetical protein n=1 Tax=Photobacterium damselae TaxID=38293 RepID=UPI000D05C747|nr:hypothetical protein [Photobacterium damselae]PSB86100.1 hypothetical protein C5F63_13165 [Photobacterium damselae subsp. damselae]